MRAPLGAVLLCVLALGCAMGSTVMAADSSPAELKQGAARCLARQGLDACDDAIRRNPGNPALLVALADLELQAGQPADALRHYHRAAELAPNFKGLNAKIDAANAQLHPKRSSVAVRPAPKAAAAQNRRFSNDAPVTESH